MSFRSRFSSSIIFCLRSTVPRGDEGDVVGVRKEGGVYLDGFSGVGGVSMCVCVFLLWGGEVMHSIGIWMMLMEGGIAFMKEIKRAQSRGLIDCMYIY